MVFPPLFGDAHIIAERSLFLQQILQEESYPSANVIILEFSAKCRLGLSFSRQKRGASRLWSGLRQMRCRPESPIPFLQGLLIRYWFENLL